MAGGSNVTNNFKFLSPIVIWVWSEYLNKLLHIYLVYTLKIVIFQIALLVTASALTYAISIPLVLLIELPAIQLWKALTERDRAPAPSERSIPPTISKSFDLVAHIRRRNEV